MSSSHFSPLVIPSTDPAYQHAQWAWIRRRPSDAEQRAKVAANTTDNFELCLRCNQYEYPRHMTRRGTDVPRLCEACDINADDCARMQARLDALRADDAPRPDRHGAVSAEIRALLADPNPPKSTPASKARFDRYFNADNGLPAETRGRRDALPAWTQELLPGEIALDEASCADPLLRGTLIAEVLADGGAGEDAARAETERAIRDIAQL